MIIVDTNVLSELMKLEPFENVLRWFTKQPPTGLFTTTVSQAEIYYGLELLPMSKRRVALKKAAIAVFTEDFDGRVLSFDSDAARAYAFVAVERRNVGRPITQFDAQILGIARSRGAGIATRNIEDFDGCGIEVVNPWIDR